MLQPGQAADGKRRHQRDIETTIAIQQGRVLPIEPEILFVGQEQRNLGAIFAGDKHLAGFVAGGIESQRAAQTWFRWLSLAKS